MRKIGSIIACAVFFAFFVNAASADDTVTLINRNGVRIKTAVWKADDHVDDSYKFFEKWRADNHKGDFGRYDYYYRLEIVPQFRPNLENCVEENAFKRFFASWIGKKMGAVVAVKATILHRWTNSSSTDLFKGEGALVLAAKGADPAKMVLGNGCFFDFTTRPSFPWILWNGGRGSDNFDDYQIKFNVTGGTSTQFSAIDNLVNFFGGVSAASRWSNLAAPLASPVFGGFETMGKSFQQALADAGTLQSQVSKTWYLRSFFKEGDQKYARILISFPQLADADENPSTVETDGSMALYIRKQGSIVMQGSGPLSPDTIMGTVELGYRQCPLNVLATGGCDSKDNPTIRATVAKSLKALDKDLNENDPVSPIFDVSKPWRQWRAVDVCRGLRNVSTLQLHLSTLDEMAVRWAFTREGGIQTAVAKATQGTTADRVAFYQAYGSTWEDIAEKCWNESDDQILNYVADNIHRPLTAPDTKINWRAPRRAEETDAFKDVKPVRPVEPDPPKPAEH